MTCRSSVRGASGWTQSMRCSWWWRWIRILGLKFQIQARPKRCCKRSIRLSQPCRRSSPQAEHFAKPTVREILLWKAASGRDGSPGPVETRTCGAEQRIDHMVRPGDGGEHIRDCEPGTTRGQNILGLDHVRLTLLGGKNHIHSGAGTS